MDKEEFKTKLIAKINDNEIIDKKEQTTTITEQVNIILFEELERLRELDNKHTQIVENETKRSNAITNTSKTILQTIGIQLMVNKK